MADKYDEFDIDSILAEVEERKARSRQIQTEFSPSDDCAFEAHPVEKNNVFLHEIEEDDDKRREGSDRLRSFFDWAETLFASIASALLVLAFFFRFSVVSGISMEPTLEDSDKLILFQFCYQPSYGDIVAIRAENLVNSETGEMGEFIVKRIIGLSGDVMYIDPDTGIVYRNGVALDEPYISEPVDIAHMGNATYPITVEEGYVFVLGDNRNNSMDSRYVDAGNGQPYVGCVMEEDILGKAVLRFSPFDRFGVL